MVRGAPPPLVRRVDRVERGARVRLAPHRPVPLQLPHAGRVSRGHLPVNFVLVSQNNLTRQSERRAHLDLQINLLAEQESTKTVALLERIAAYLHVPVPTDPSECELAAPTAIRDVVSMLDPSAASLHDGPGHAPSNVPYGRGRTIPSVAELESTRQGLPRTSHRGTDDQPPPAPLPKPRPYWPAC